MNGLYQLLLHEEDGAGGAKESTHLELNFQTWAWRKIKKRKVKKGAAAAAAAAAANNANNASPVKAEPPVKTE